MRDFDDFSDAKERTREINQSVREHMYECKSCHASISEPAKPCPRCGGKDFKITDSENL